MYGPLSHLIGIRIGEELCELLQKVLMILE
jgi:hypothetical protein